MRIAALFQALLQINSLTLCSKRIRDINYGSRTAALACRRRRRRRSAHSARRLRRRAQDLAVCLCRLEVWKRSLLVPQSTNPTIATSLLGQAPAPVATVAPSQNDSRREVRIGAFKWVKLIVCYAEPVITSKLIATRRRTSFIIARSAQLGSPPE